MRRGEEDEEGEEEGEEGYQMTGLGQRASCHCQGSHYTVAALTPPY